MYWFILIGGVALIIVALMGEKNKRLDSYLTQYQQRNRVETTLDSSSGELCQFVRQKLTPRFENTLG